ncbi:hypothetical protein ACFYRD_36485 [Streptomyces hirsutus]
MKCSTSGHAAFGNVAAGTYELELGKLDDGTLLQGEGFYNYW